MNTNQKVFLSVEDDLHHSGIGVHVLIPCRKTRHLNRQKQFRFGKLWKLKESIVAPIERANLEGTALYFEEHHYCSSMSGVASPWGVDSTMGLGDAR